MTPLEKIDQLRRKKGQINPYRIPALVLTLLGFVVLVWGLFTMTGIWTMWMALILFAPNWYMIIRDFSFDYKINNIWHDEVYKTTKEEHGREETS